MAVVEEADVGKGREATGQWKGGKWQGGEATDQKVHNTPNNSLVQESLVPQFGRTDPN